MSIISIANLYKDNNTKSYLAINNTDLTVYDENINKLLFISLNPEEYNYSREILNSHVKNSNNANIKIIDLYKELNYYTLNEYYDIDKYEMTVKKTKELIYILFRYCISDGNDRKFNIFFEKRIHNFEINKIEKYFNIFLKSTKIIHNKILENSEHFNFCSSLGNNNWGYSYGELSSIAKILKTININRFYTNLYDKVSIKKFYDRIESPLITLIKKRKPYSIKLKKTNIGISIPYRHSEQDIHNITYIWKRTSSYWKGSSLTENFLYAFLVELNCLEEFFVKLQKLAIQTL